TGVSVTPGYFRAMGVDVLRGRDFASGDRADAVPVMLVNETFAKRYWPGGDVVGRTVLDGGEPVTVIGVVRDVRQRGLLEEPEAQAYRPFAQRPNTTLTFALRVG